MRYVCSVCGYIYDEGKEKTAFAHLPGSWKCPVCKASKGAFVPEEPKETPENPGTPAPLDGEAPEDLSAGQLAALFSNLARGCEKQYKGPEAALFYRLAGYFEAVSPPAADMDMDRLEALLQEDLQKGYPALAAAAEATGDRGTRRICTWGDKVTRMLDSLLNQYLDEGEDFLKDTDVWVCSVCGFIYVGDSAPDLCPVCKVPSWKFDKIEGRESI